MIRLKLALAYLEVFGVQKSVYYKRPDGDQNNCNDDSLNYVLDEVGRDCLFEAHDPGTG